jgi:MFS transporter, OFA family, oxalate/formate antiporter
LQIKNKLLGKALLFMLKKNFNRWHVFLAGWIINFFASAEAIFSVISKPITQLHGWTMTQFSFAFSINILVLTLLGIFSGKIADKYGAKKNMYVGAVLFGAGWFLTGMCKSLPQLYLVYGVIAGSGDGIIYNAVIATTLRWFPDKSGKICGMLLSSAAIGPFILAPFASIILQRVGVVNTFKILGTIFFVAIAAVGWMMESAPVGYKPYGWNPEKTETKSASGRNYNWKQMISSPLFYLLIIVFICASTAGTMMINSTSVIAQTQLGTAATVGAIAVSVSTLLNFIGRLSFGVIYDRLGDFKALLISLVMTIVALLLIGSAKTMPLFIICVCILGFAFGGLLVVFPPITSKCFGAKNLGINYGIMFLGYAGGSFVGPRLSSYFMDTTGSLAMAYTSAAALAAIGSILVILIMFSKASGWVKTR